MLQYENNIYEGTAKVNHLIQYMKQTFTQKPVIPEGWISKPNVNAHNFLDWCVKFQDWQNMIYKNKPNK